MLEATLALSPRDAYILVGAQAIYIRVPEDKTGLASFTHDSDLIVDPRYAKNGKAARRQISSRGFQLTGHSAGIYEQRTAPAPHPRIDILVPEAVDHAWDPEFYDPKLAMRQSGLEGCLFDNDVMEVSTIDDGPPLTVPLRVAGITSLIVAKTWKLWDRSQEGDRDLEMAAGDVADLYRLLRAVPDSYPQTLRRLISHRESRETVDRAGLLLKNLCSRSGVATRSLRARLAHVRNADRALMSFMLLAEEFSNAVASAAVRCPT